MEQAVEQCGDGGGVTEELPPVVDRTIRGKHRGGPFVAAHAQLEQVLGGGMRQLAHAEVIDDEQRHAGQLGQIGLAGVGERCLGEFFEEGVRFAVDDAVALLDRGAADGLGNVALARTGGNRPILPDTKVPTRRSTIGSIRVAESAWRSCAGSSFLAGACSSFDNRTGVGPVPRIG